MLMSSLNHKKQPAA